MVVQDIQEVAQYLELKFKISLEWRDARIMFYNLKVNEDMNTLTLDEQLSIWTPTIVFWNTKNQLRTINDRNTLASISRNGNGSIIGKEVNEDIEVYSGAENKITISRVYSVKFFCEYQMAWYPFDQQTCRVEMVMDGVLDNYADLIPNGVHFSGAKELTQYFIKSFSIRNEKMKSKMTVVVSITLGRRLLGTFLTIFFPTILLNVIGYSTNFFKAFFFEVSVIANNIQLINLSFKAVITVNLTSMLVLTTMFINVSNSLPKTSYMKMVDAWLLFNLLYPFIVVLLHTYMDTLRSDDDREINHHGKAITINNDEDESPNTIKVGVSNNKGSKDEQFFR